MSPEEIAEAARLLDAVVDQVDDGTLEANVRESRYLRGAAAALRALAVGGPQANPPTTEPDALPQ